MDVVSLSPLRVGSVLWQPRAAAYRLTVVVKATFQLFPGESRLAETQEDLNEDDNHWNDDPARSLYSPGDFAPFKMRADVVLVGHAFSPRAEPVRSLTVRVLVAEMDKPLEIVGNRGANDEVTPFSRMPIRYERAAGGAETMNPVGVENNDVLDGTGSVNVLSLAAPHSGAFIEPVGYGPIAPSWPLRRGQLGRHAAGWNRTAWNRTPLPEDIELGYFNAAPRDQQIEAIRDNERMVLDNLHPELPQLVTRLPGVHPRAFVDRARGAEELGLRGDTLWIDTDRSICTLVWRGQVALESPTEAGRVLVALEDGRQRIAWQDVERMAAARAQQATKKPGETRPTLLSGSSSGGSMAPVPAEPKLADPAVRADPKAGAQAIPAMRSAVPAPAGQLPSQAPTPGDVGPSREREIDLGRSLPGGAPPAVVASPPVTHAGLGPPLQLGESLDRVANAKLGGAARFMAMAAPPLAPGGGALTGRKRPLTGPPPPMAERAPNMPAVDPHHAADTPAPAAKRPLRDLGPPLPPLVDEPSLPTMDLTSTHIARVMAPALPFGPAQPGPPKFLHRQDPAPAVNVLRRPVDDLTATEEPPGLSSSMPAWLAPSPTPSSAVFVADQEEFARQAARELVSERDDIARGQTARPEIVGGRPTMRDAAIVPSTPEAPSRGDAPPPAQPVRAGGRDDVPHTRPQTGDAERALAAKAKAAPIDPGRDRVRDAIERPMRSEPPPPPPPQIPSAARDGALEAQSAARKARRAPLPVTKAEGEGAMAARRVTADIVELLHADAAAVVRLRGAPGFAAFLGATGRAPNEDDPTADLAGDVRKQIFAALSRGVAVDVGDVGDAVAVGVAQDGSFTPPLLLVAGELELGFSEVEVLRATLLALEPLLPRAPQAGSAEHALGEAVELAVAWLGRLGGEGASSVAEALTQRIRDAGARASRFVPPGYLEAHTERIVLERRAYQTRPVLGDRWVRAQLVSAATNVAVPTYLPLAAAPRLPLFTRFSARALVEAHPRQDQFEGHPTCLRVVALARCLPALPLVPPRG